MARIAKLLHFVYFVYFVSPTVTLSLLSFQREPGKANPSEIIHQKLEIYIPNQS